MNIIELAKEAGAGHMERYDLWQISGETLERFANLIRCHSLENAAKVSMKQKYDLKTRQSFADAIRSLK